MNHKKLLLTLTLCLCALLCTVVTASASEVQEHSHPVCGKTHTDIGDHTGTCGDVTWTAWDGTSEIAYESTTKTAYIYLAENVNISNKLTIPQGHTLYLCLNGRNIVRTDNLIQIQDSANFTLCDCKGDKAKYGKLDSNKGGRVVSFESTKPGTFTMYGGIITGGNVTGNSGGGVFVGDKNTFTMYGGTITGNSAGSPGGGVVVYGAFNMYGGAITGNFAREGGGGVAAYGAFTMSGGAITDNTCSGSYNGGGVYVKNDTWSTGAITLSGSVQIKDNYKRSNSDKKPSNLYLAKDKGVDKTINVVGPLTGSSIGVTTATEPGTGSNVTFANSSTNTITTGIFTPDTAGVLVGVAADGKSAYLYKCSHVYNEWAYDEEYHWKKCSNVGCDSVEAGSKIAHTWDYPATYTAPKTCTVCGATQGEPLTRSYYYYTPSAAENKKDSPKTADPGVLLYAGLALASLTGLACTAKKRH